MISPYSGVLRVHKANILLVELGHTDILEALEELKRIKSTSVAKSNKDYDELFKRICRGEVVLAFVDYSFPGDEHVYRDPCSIRRVGEYDIHISARGICYGSVYQFDRDKGDERELFIKQCEWLNVIFA